MEEDQVDEDGNPIESWNRQFGGVRGVFGWYSGAFRVVVADIALHDLSLDPFESSL
jgi:hypothetical protein